MLPINYLVVLVAAAANFIIGFLLHGPVLGKTWMRLAHITPTGNEKFSGMVPQMVKNFIVNLVFAYVLATMILYTGAIGATRGMIFAFWVWLGFVATSTSIDVIWMGKSYKLWLFDSLSALVAILAMGAIIGGWQ